MRMVAAANLLRQTSEPLAVRTEILGVSGLNFSEVGLAAMPRHGLRGRIPLSFLAENDEDNNVWLSWFVSTFLERDLLISGRAISPVAMTSFFTMFAHHHG